MWVLVVLVVVGEEEWLEVRVSVRMVEEVGRMAG